VAALVLTILTGEHAVSRVAATLAVYDLVSPHIASAECKKGKALPPQRPLFGLVTASVLLGL
jgi:hypothetical protein